MCRLLKKPDKKARLFRFFSLIISISLKRETFWIDVCKNHMCLWIASVCWV